VKEAKSKANVLINEKLWAAEEKKEAKPEEGRNEETSCPRRLGRPPVVPGGCNPWGTGLPEHIVAQVNEEQIPVEQFDRSLGS